VARTLTERSPLLVKEFVRQVATLTGLPAQCDWVKSKRGVNDVAIFDFSK
jgi:hypothetical protein